MSHTQGDLLRYLSVNERDEAWGLAVTTIGYQFIPAQGSYPLSRHPEHYDFLPQQGRVLNEYQLVYITKGSGFFRSSSTRELRPIEAGTLMILFPGEWHSYCPNRETGWDEYWVGFKGVHINRLVAQSFFSPQEPLLSVGLSSTLIGLYEKMIRLTEEEKPGYQQLVAGMVMHLLGSLYYKVKNRSFSNNSLVDKINEARIWMKEHVEDPLSPEELASRLGLSYSYFRRLFKAYTGISPAQYQKQQRLLTAKEMLTTTTLSISEIGYRLRFDTPGQFSTFFREHEGVSPSLFRKRAH
ncbi:MAG: helix-turn-helix domain-containing protein [Parabacteroides sp.]